MDETSKTETNQAPEDKAQELTPEELSQVAGGGPGHGGWIGIDSFKP